MHAVFSFCAAIDEMNSSLKIALLRQDVLTPQSMASNNSTYCEEDDFPAGVF